MPRFHFFSNAEVSLVDFGAVLKSMEWSFSQACVAMLDLFLKAFLFLICSVTLVFKLFQFLQYNSTNSRHMESCKLNISHRLTERSNRKIIEDLIFTINFKILETDWLLAAMM